ncbi:MAG: hypothetical protein Q8L14_08460 [Myxococcales bacterium]|nr:hypothetical protein [Myxococcales bacterium]
MSTFEQLAALPSPGMAILVDVSTDRFATTLSVSSVTQRWSTVPGFFNLPSNNYFNGGISSVGRLQRSLSTDGTPAAGTVSLVLDNTDGAFDWLTAPSTVSSTVMKARFRVYVALFDPANPTDNQVQLAGTYISLDNPRRNESRVFLELADDILGDAVDLSLTPSLNSWLNHASTNNGNTPWAASSGVLAAGVQFVADETRPLPLAFGSARVPLLRMISGDQRYHPHVICCTTNTSLTASEPDSFLQSLESSVFGSLPSNSALYFLDRSPFNITRDGRTWRIWLVQFDTVGMLNSSWVMNDVLEGEFGGPGSNGTAVGFRKTFTDTFFSKVGTLLCRAFPLSSHTYTTAPSSATGGFAPGILLSNVARDLLEQYARGSIIVDDTSFDDVAAHSPASRAALYVGDIGSVSFRGAEPAVIAEAGQLRGLLRGLCSAGMFDLTALQDGQVRVLSNTATYEAYVGAAALSAVRLEETRIVADSLDVRTPSQGQRWAPYNRVFLQVGDASGYLPPGRHGPFDHGSDTEGNLAAWGRPFTKVIDATYADVSLGYGNVHVPSGTGFERITSQFPVESIIRPVISFRYGLEALELDLGDYFILSLTRGGQTTLLDTYVDVMWKTESLNLIPDTGQVEVTAVWAGDVLSDIPFLLDTESAITRTDSAACGDGDTASDDTFILVGGGGSDFTSTGVTAGDILVLQDASEAADAFDRNRGVRIIAVTAADQLQLAEAIGASVTVATWKILRGYTTYPVAGDPGYPDGGRMFGKAASATIDGVFSNSDPANRMLGG